MQNYNSLTCGTEQNKQRARSQEQIHPPHTIHTFKDQ